MAFALLVNGFERSLQVPPEETQLNVLRNRPFHNGHILHPHLAEYRVPRFSESSKD